MYPRSYILFLFLLLSGGFLGQCLTSYTWEYSPQQVDGAWGNEEEVQICLSIDHDDWQGGNHYLHALIPQFGSGWDLSTLEVISPSSCSNDGGYWAWYPGPITSEASGMTHGAGFYYESPHGGTDSDNPGDNFGDRCPIGLQLDFCFQLKTVAFDDCMPEMDLDIQVNTLSDDESGGSFLSPTCTEDEDALLVSSIQCCDAQAGPDLELSFCTDGPIVLINDYLQDVDSGAWHFQSPSNPSLGDTLFFEPGVDTPGTYVYVVTDTVNDCENLAFIEIEVDDGFNAGNDVSITLCENGGIVYLFDQLSGTPDAGGTWTDPMGDVWQEPFSPSNDMTGIYTYSFPAIGSCEASNAEVEVESIPEADAGENSSVVLCSCEETVDLLDLLDGSPQPDGQWTDSEGNVISSDF
ncbi:MAG: hypothetical protein HKN79_00200, partial [Flavobacteriales bacterium]|nr:hypothetical protein [Flavobacteriales bacterium]